MEKYSVILPNEREKTYRFVTLFILVINLLVFGFIYFSSDMHKLKDIAAWGASLSLLSLLLYLANFFSGKFAGFRVEISFILLGMIWLFCGKYLLGLCVICFAIVGFYNNRKFKVVFTREHIIYPSFPKKIFLWKDVSNVILKDNMLTIDLKNNRLIQSVIDKDSLEPNEREFNLFCREQLGKPIA